MSVREGSGSAEHPLQARVERAATAAERPLRRAVGSGRANPLPHAGTISVFLLAVVIGTGVYITLFYEYGFAASYDAVARLQAHPVQRVMRALHRYSSAALVLTTVVHAWRIFVAGRFGAGRRFRWLTGVTALVVVWLAGVTGYWLVWDVRAQAIGEAIDAVVGGFGWGAALVSTYTGAGAGSGATLMVVVWFAHLGLTALIGWAMWRHLRRSRLPWLPPRHWMALMGGALVLVSLLFPLGMLDAADPSRLVPDLSLDPFILFLVPPLLSSWAVPVAVASVVAVGLVAAVPWLLRATRAPVVAIDAERCTGCDLCVVDCPYLALEMVDRDEPGAPQLAVVDPAACVGCGICLGSCAFGALALGDESSTGPSIAELEVEGREVVVACRRHLAGSTDLAEDRVVVEVPCTGAIHPQAVGELVRAGATGIQVLGCAPSDCLYGIGNQLAHERLAGDRAPHVPRRYASVAREDFVAVGDGARAVAEPGGHPSTDADHLPEPSRARVVAALVVVASIVAVAVATLAPFGGDPAAAGVRVVVDHVPGRVLEGQEAGTGASGRATVVLVEVDGEEVARTTVPTWQGRSVGVVDVAVDPGTVDLRVALVDGDDETVLQEGPVEVAEGRRIVVEATDAPPPPGVEEGRRVFVASDRGSCDVCHSTTPGDDGVGPSLAGVATRAETAVPGMTAEEYLRQSILDPDAVIAPGFRSGQMLGIYEDRLSEQDLESLIAYLMTLEEE